MRGVFLLEALIALVVFALATIGLFGVLAAALRESGNAQWRNEAFDIASSTLARMWAEDPAVLAARYDAATNGTGYQALLAAAMRLPGVTPFVNAPVVTIEDGALGGRRVSVTVRWRVPDERDPHRVSVSEVASGI
jgi:type IV pilus assembly protein PilV